MNPMHRQFSVPNAFRTQQSNFRRDVKKDKPILLILIYTKHEQATKHAFSYVRQDTYSY